MDKAEEWATERRVFQRYYLDRHTLSKNTCNFVDGGYKEVFQRRYRINYRFCVGSIQCRNMSEYELAELRKTAKLEVHCTG